MDFIEHLSAELEAHHHPENAKAMKAYMKHKFAFYGIKSQERKQLLQSVAGQHRSALVQNIRAIGLALFKKPYRELHYCAQELLTKYLKKSYIKEDIGLIRTLLTTNSWWDTVDHISKHILGYYLMQFPEERTRVIQEFSNSGNMWLIRSTLLFQLAYKHKTDEDVLFSQCINHRHSEEFFIQKAIGWALREYAKVQPEAVLAFANSAQLKPLSYREAIRNIT